MRFTDSHQNRMTFENTESVRNRVYLGGGWKYIQDDCLLPGERAGEYDAYGLTKTGQQNSPAAVSFDDSGWREIAVPHDLTAGMPLDPKERDYNGYLPQKDFWYRRFFKLEETDREKRIVLHFEGISGESRIWVNGVLVKEHRSAYCGADIDITDIVTFGGEVNLLAVFTDNSRMQGWWYHGCGIFRPVWIEKTDFSYIADETVHITTEKEETPGGKWRVSVCCEARKRYGTFENGSIRAYVTDPDGNTCGAGKAEIKKGVYESGQRIEFEAEAPRLWDIGEGWRYVLTLILEINGEIRDRYGQVFGFREIRFDAEKGFLLNGKKRKIRGFCFHEDEGNLGLAIDRRVYERRIRNLIAMGANAYRCSHNAPAKELLELCDEYGILVMEETRKFGTDENAMEELEWMIRRDRNHPCVIIWSLGNEEPWQGHERGRRIAETMRRRIYQLDGERPVTMAMHDGFRGTGAADAVDVLGVNYNHDRLEQIRARYADKPMLGTEIHSLADTVIECGYEAPGSQSACETLLFADAHDFHCGTFTWAGEDYRGEHRNLGFFTDACPLDINGNRKDAFYWYAAMWNREPVVHICGHWNPGGEKQRKVTVYSNATEVSLWLNGRLFESAVPDRWRRAIFTVGYEEGELTAKCICKEKEISHTIRTSKEAYAFRIWTEQEEYPADERSGIPVWVEAIDRDGVRVPTASHVFCVQTDGKTEIVCTDNADPYCSAFPDKEEMCLYKGRGKIILRALGVSGRAVIMVSGMLKSAQCTVTLTEKMQEREESCYIREEMAPCENPYINDWFISHIFEKEPDIYGYLTDDHYLYWRKTLERSTMLDRGMPFYFSRQGGYVVYCMEPDMPWIEQGRTGAVVFEEITGSARILISMRDHSNRVRKQFYYEKKESDSVPVKIELPGIVTGDRLILKLVISGNHAKCGITAPVRFET